MKMTEQELQNKIGAMHLRFLDDQKTSPTLFRLRMLFDVLVFYDILYFC